MTVPFMDAYVKLLIKTCHRRGVHAMVSLAKVCIVIRKLAKWIAGRYGRADSDQRQ